VDGGGHGRGTGQAGGCGAVARRRVGWAPSQATPSLLVLTNIAVLADRDHPDHAAAAHLLSRLTGPVELTPSAVERLLCEGSWRQIITDGHRILGVTAAAPNVSTSLKAAVIARDGHCRFPGCRIAPQVCDTHHLIPVSDGGPTGWTTWR
jgi:hypothetical protein